MIPILSCPLDAVSSSSSSSHPLNHFHHDYRPTLTTTTTTTTTTAAVAVAAAAAMNTTTTATITMACSTSHQQPVPSDGLSISNPSEYTKGTSGSECLVSTTSSTVAMDNSNNGNTRQRVHPAAMVLRLRVTQVVCGIMTCVLGAVACIEERGEFRVGTGVVAGVMTVVASIASIHATFESPMDRTRWIQYTTTSNNDCGGKSCVLSSLWAVAVITNMVMLAFVFMAFASSSKNLIIIGSLELALGVIVLVILVCNLCMALHYKELQKK